MVRQQLLKPNYASIYCFKTAVFGFNIMLPLCIRWLKPSVFLVRQQLLNQKLYIHPMIEIIGFLVQHNELFIDVCLIIKYAEK